MVRYEKGYPGEKTEIFSDMFMLLSHYILKVVTTHNFNNKKKDFPRQECKFSIKSCFQLSGTLDSNTDHYLTLLIVHKTMPVVDYQLLANGN